MLTEADRSRAVRPIVGMKRSRLADAIVILFIVAQYAIPLVAAVWFCAWLLS